jgi:hypothetical protein
MGAHALSDLEHLLEVLLYLCGGLHDPGRERLRMTFVRRCLHLR